MAGRDRVGGPSTTQVLAALTPLPIAQSLSLPPLPFPWRWLASCPVTCGAFGLMGASSLNYGLKCLINANAVADIGRGQLGIEQAKRGMTHMEGYVGQKTKDIGQNIENKAHAGGAKTY
ncbi:hypothetical protein V6N11_009829 [Hibiscus sabdariffa]|uniref:Uncharacterized protein n=2 Tax=Hibiscus sabdariffa TaxID=183260 RepID=A0ABR2BWK6_9ROSI